MKQVNTSFRTESTNESIAMRAMFRQVYVSIHSSYLLWLLVFVPEERQIMNVEKYFIRECEVCELNDFTIHCNGRKQIARVRTMYPYFKDPAEQLRAQGALLS